MFILVDKCGFCFASFPWGELLQFLINFIPFYLELFVQMFPLNFSFLSSLPDPYLLVTYLYFSVSKTEGERKQVEGSINGPEINCLIWRREAERQFHNPGSKATKDDTETAEIITYSKH